MFKTNSRIGDILDAALLIILVVLMFMFPSFALIFSIIGNVIMCIVAYRSNILKSIGCIVSTYAFMAIFCAISGGFTMQYLFDCVISTFNLLLVGFTIGITCKYTGELFKIVSFGTTANLFISLLEIVRYRLIYSTSVLDALINEPVKMFLKSYEAVAKSSGIDISSALGMSFDDLIWTMQQALSMIVPALLILSSLGIAYLVFVVARKILKHYNVTLYTKHFNEIQLPAGTSLALVATYLISMFSSSTFSAACANILILLAVLYVVCGLSVVEYKFKAKANSVFFRIIVYVTAFFVLNILSLILPFFNIFTFLMIIGMFDAVYDFRKLKKIDNQTEEE